VADFPYGDDLAVLAGTNYGEARGCGRFGMENVSQTILNRKADGWAPTIAAVCLAPYQFSCWNAKDPNRAQILAAPSTDPTWLLALDVARAALAGRNPNRIAGADSYFARSMVRAPYWAAPPATPCYSDQWHAFWHVRPAGQSAPVISVHSSLTADDLNQLEINGFIGAVA
jgi:N-acetylmuramoyl-L-alanine amidase